MKALLSIKPQYVERILNGEKKYEYRRRLFGRDDVDHIAIYSTSPSSAVVAEAEVADIIESAPADLWESTYKQGGISKDQFMAYFSGASKAFAIKLGDVDVFEEPMSLCEYAPNLKRPPQSFAYVG